ncbi:hypothetical protein [Streptomyces sp. NRRL B-1347]|uniref:hypothetical protein n=1 Tax=Streptomyces sp. NRRL B-1347 TaxID=1476877 RepID=UPI0004C9C372|nr:hypothetical protein [Streptomyces sp. NRRL B-1347]
MALNTSLRTAVTQLGRMRTSVGQAATGLTRLRTSTGDASKAVDGIKKSAGQAGTSVGKLRTAAGDGNTALGKLRTGARSGSNALGTFRTSANRSDTAVRKLRSGLRTADGALDKAKGGSDKLKSSLDRLRGSAGKAEGALRDVKRQADAVERSVGKAGRNADRGGKSMGRLGKGLKGASLAQRGLNLAMAANPFGLVMALLAPLITKFVDMDKVAKLLRRGVSAAWSGIKEASSSASRFLKPLFTGVVNAFRSPVVQLVRGLNILIGAMNRIKFKVPGWVPGLGGKGFGFDLPRIPVPHLAEGGIVRARPGGTLALVAERGESEAVIPLNRLERMLGSRHDGAGLRRLADAVERLAERPVHVNVDAQTIARAVWTGQRQLARR